MIPDILDSNSAILYNGKLMFLVLPCSKESLCVSV